MKIVTANRLDDGTVVYLANEGWVGNIGSAAVLNAPDAVEAALGLAARAVADGQIIGVEPIEVVPDSAGMPIPKKLRERIRALGPTIEYGPRAAAALAA